MSSARAPSWLPPLSFTAAAVLAAIFTYFRLLPFIVTGQLIVLLIILRAFCYWPPFVRWLGRMPVPHRVVFGLLIAGVIYGHYTLDGRTRYPFIVWEIFGVPRHDDPVECRELIATTADGKQVRLLVEQLFPSIIQFNLPLDKNGDPLPTMEPLVHAMAKIYNQLHPDDPVRQVDLVVMGVQLHPSPDESRHEPSCELLKHYAISSDL
jgi:hypothetical protein